MGLFAKNPNEIAYSGGKKHWRDVIKCTAPDSNYLAWRQPEEDFNTNSTLVVMPGEVAVFVKNGIIQGVIDRTTVLTTENYPFISRLRNAFTGGISTFNCVIYYVRTTVSIELTWGTDSPIQVRDKVWSVRTEVKSRAGYKIAVSDPVKFIQKLVGNSTPIMCNSDLHAYFDNELQGKIKNALSCFLNDYKGELIGLDAHLDKLSNQIKPHVDTMLKEYGLKCVQFSLVGLDIDTSNYDRIDNSQIQRIARERDYQADNDGFDILKDDRWAMTHNYKVLQGIANNGGAGNVAVLGAGLGIAPIFNQLAQSTFSSSNIPKTSNNCSGKQDSNSSSKPVYTKADIEKELEILKDLLSKQLIPKDIYEEKVKEIVSRM